MSWHGEMYAEVVERNYWDRGSLVENDVVTATRVARCSTCYALVAEDDKVEHYEWHNPDTIPSWRTS
jgi:hypothetical protein